MHTWPLYFDPTDRPSNIVGVVTAHKDNKETCEEQRSSAHLAVQMTEEHLGRIAELEAQVRQLKKARRASGAVLASLRRRGSADGARSLSTEPAAGDGDFPRTQAACGSDSEDGTDVEEMLAEFEEHECAIASSACRGSKI